MVNFKKIDEKDIVFVKKELTAKEDKEFSDFLKLRKAKSAAKTIFQTISTSRRATV